MSDNEFIEDVKNGLTIKQLSKKYNCGTTTVSRRKKILRCYTDVSERGNTIVKCENCSADISVNNWRLKDQDKFFCCKGCSISYNNRKRIGDKNPNWLGTSTTDYRKNALREYGKKCMMCGYDKEKCLHVHHIDKDRNNGEIKNLIVLCPNCHTEVHVGITDLPD